jgi:hypothetical protein
MDAWPKARGWKATDAIGQATDDAFRLARERKATRFVGELAGWRRRAGIDSEIAIEVATPYALELAADPARAAEAWREIGCPYEAALALADADEEEPLRRAHAELQALDAMRPPRSSRAGSANWARAASRAAPARGRATTQRASPRASSTCYRS